MTSGPGDRDVEDLLRMMAPQVLGAVVRRYGRFDTAEDAVQEALATAAAQWPTDGIPDNPKAWLIRVASRRLIDVLRRDQARQRREATTATWTLTEPWHGAADPADRPAGESDDTLVLLFMCCDASLPPASQIALTLRAVGGLTTVEIARAFLVPESTMTRRITRTKQSIRDKGTVFRLPATAERTERLGAVLHVLYLVFTEGYASTGGITLHRAELATEAIRLTRTVHRALPHDPEVAGLLALMLLTDARRAARTGPDGQLVPMADQDRALWDSAAITEGVSLLTAALATGPTGPYQLQAAIAALHDEAASVAETDWPQIVSLYELILQISDNPIVSLNHAVAVAMVDGPERALTMLAELGTDPRIADDHRLYSVRANLHEMLNDRPAARAAYLDAATRTSNRALQRYLRDRATKLTDRT